MTIQILGNDLGQAVEDNGIDAKLVYKTKRSDLGRFGRQFEVWELSEEERLKIDAIPDEVWEDKGYGWYRCGERNSKPDGVLYIVNGHEMLGYESRYTDEYEEEEDEGKPDTPERFRDFMQYLDEAEGISADRNIAATANTLAKLNNLTLAEFMAKYY